MIGLGWVGLIVFYEILPRIVAIATALGVATLGISMGTALGRIILIGLGVRREFLACVIIGATIGVPAILILAANFGAAGGAWGLAVGELSSVTAQVVYVVHRWNSHRERSRWRAAVQRLSPTAPAPTASGTRPASSDSATLSHSR